MKRLLVTGASGFLGWNVCDRAGGTWAVHGTFFSHPVEIPGAVTLKADLRNYRELKEVFQRVKPHAVIHTAAQKDPNYCEENSDESEKINVDASLNIAGLCDSLRIPCAFTSTDIVFDGMNPPYKEEDPVSPINTYGEQKVRAEEGMKQRCRDVTVCRMPLMFGISGSASSSFLQRMVRDMKEGKELTLFTDEFRSPVSGKAAAEGLLLMLENVLGTVHLGGSERFSRFELGEMIMGITKIASAKIRACKQGDHPMAARRPPDVTLDSSRAFSSGYRPGLLAESLREELGKDGFL